MNDNSCKILELYRVTLFLFSDATFAPYFIRRQSGFSVNFSCRLVFPVLLKARFAFFKRILAVDRFFPIDEFGLAQKNGLTYFLLCSPSQKSTLNLYSSRITHLLICVTFLPPSEKKILDLAFCILSTFHLQKHCKCNYVGAFLLNPILVLL